MSAQLDPSELCDITRGKPFVAVAESIEGLGCSVYADGRELAVPWVNRKVEDLVNSPVQNGTLLTSETAVRYFILKRDPELEEFAILTGPLNADEVRPALTKAKAAGM